MNSSINGQNGPGKKDRRELAREKARQMREEQRKRKLRQRWMLRGGIGVGLLAVAIIIALVVVNGARPASTAGPLNMASDGILLTGNGTSISAVKTPALAAGQKPVATKQADHAKTVNIVMYIDYLCPYCGQFESTNTAQIQSWLKAGNVSLEIHPISLLDPSSQGTKYSTRAANAAACVANYQPADFFAVNSAFYASQPTENTTGLTNAQLVSLVKKAGVTNTNVPGCITGQTFAPWVTAASTRALSGPLPGADVKKVAGTPTVLANGVSYKGALDDAAAFQAFVLAQAGATG